MTTHTSLYADNQTVFATAWEKPTSWAQRLTSRLAALGARMQRDTQAGQLDDRTLRDIGMSRGEIDWLAQDGALRMNPILARHRFHVLD